MRPDLRDYIYANYGKLFKQDKFYPCIDCNDGWFWLIDNLFNTIKKEIKYNKRSNIEITTIKEKFGGLNIYYSGGDDVIKGMISLSMHMSYTICEFCGTTENVGRTKGWISTCCKNCHSKIKNRKDLEWETIKNIRQLKLLRLKYKIKRDKLIN